jgi:hypothetical protein
MQPDMETHRLRSMNRPLLDPAILTVDPLAVCSHKPLADLQAVIQYCCHRQAPSCPISSILCEVGSHFRGVSEELQKLRFRSGAQLAMDLGCENSRFPNLLLLYSPKPAFLPLTRGAKVLLFA